jgi:hypothetical protein
MVRRSVTAAAVTLLATAGLTFTAAPTQASACPLGYECVTTYYSDSSHSTVIGGKVEYCDGDSNAWGTRSAYYDYSRTAC